MVERVVQQNKQQCNIKVRTAELEDNLRLMEVLWWWRRRWDQRKCSFITTWQVVTLVVMEAQAEAGKDLHNLGVLMAQMDRTEKVAVEEALIQNMTSLVTGDGTVIIHHVEFHVPGVGIRM